MEIPKMVSGRAVTPRGVHLQPSGHHEFWCGNEARRTQVLDMLVGMHLSWVVMLTDGDSAVQKYDGKTVVEWLLDKGVIPIIRDYAKLPRHFNNMATVEKLANIYDRYGVPLLLKLWNEPQDDREWNSGTTPDDWWKIFIDRWNSAAPIVLECGGYPGFPDGPGYDFDKQHPFRDTDRYLWRDGLAWYGAHSYSKGRPINYPRDQVSQGGVMLSQQRKDMLLDDYKDDPAWTDPSLEKMNAQREALKQPGKTVLDDDTCWLAFKKVEHYARRELGHPVPMAVVEGGWVPRDRAGTGPDTDYRWPHTTPRRVADNTLEAFDMANFDGLFAVCPWLLACDFMGHGGWEFDSWWGWAYADKYGWEKPVVLELRKNPPLGPTLPEIDWGRILELTEQIQEVCR